MNTDRFLTIPAEEYHAASRSGRCMSSHLLADFRQSPQLYHREVSGEIAQTESPVLTLGRAAHCLILEGRAAFDEQYIVSDGPVNPKTGEPYGKATKAYAEWLSSQTREIVSPKDFGFIVKLQKSVWLHDAASALLDDGVSGGCHPHRILRRPLPDPHGLVLPRTRHRRPQDLRQPQVVRG